MIAVLLGCPVEPDTGAATLPATEPRLLVSGQMNLADFDAPAALELDLDGNVTWSLTPEPDAGAFGARRLDDGQTLVAWTRLPPDTAAGLVIADDDGAVSWRYDEKLGGPLTFPHGVDALGDGTVLVADTYRGDVLAIDTSGSLLWDLSVLSSRHAGAPSGMSRGVYDGKEYILVTQLDNLDGQVPNDTLTAFLVEGDEEPRELWVWPPERSPESSLWIHGPRMLDDGTVLGSMAGHGQVVRLDLEGNEIERFPPDEHESRLAFPRDAAFLPDGRLVVLDATEVLLVTDPGGAFEVEVLAELSFGYSLEVVY
ncbi:MAG: PQQ-binding-like beta-propeller repeat protein [Deltaproteobacteria bacterium]|nr:PQQ-binding-like beta-propeller repeat protein [Deltaproteobacteria bacterium]